jgi:phenylpropionate dioxygenase-like ring-hydroxylating dioxygenase large terminal subunit
MEILWIMSDLSVSLQALERSRSQLSVSAYFDEHLYRREQELIFQSCPAYLGHAASLPEVGDYFALAREGEGRALIRTPQGIELVSNVCRHRQAVMLKGRGNTGGSVVCPLHRWTYDLHGQLMGAPHFVQDPCLSLRNYPVQEWNGLVFEGGSSRRAIATDLDKLSVAAELDFSGYVFHSAQQHACDYNWKTFIEVYLEDYHVVPFHPGLSGFVECNDLRWEFGPQFSVQTVGVHSALARPGTTVYQQWHDAVKSRYGEAGPPHGAIWLTLYPTVMVEWYPSVLVVSTLHPQGPRRTLNTVEFFYPEEIAAFEPEYVAAQQAAYMETVVEDDEIAERMDAGRKALMERGDDEAGPYQSPMEDGMQHFHEWYRTAMGDSLESRAGASAGAAPTRP